jgi:hypothetical protein
VDMPARAIDARQQSDRVRFHVIHIGNEPIR